MRTLSQTDILAEREKHQKLYYLSSYHSTPIQRQVDPFRDATLTPIHQDKPIDGIQMQYEYQGYADPHEITMK